MHAGVRARPGAHVSRGEMICIVYNTPMAHSNSGMQQAHTVARGTSSRGRRVSIIYITPIIVRDMGCMMNSEGLLHCAVNVASPLKPRVDHSPYLDDCPAPPAYKPPPHWDLPWTKTQKQQRTPPCVNGDWGWLWPLLLHSSSIIKPPWELKRDRLPDT